MSHEDIWQKNLESLESLNPMASRPLIGEKYTKINAILFAASKDGDVMLLYSSNQIWVDQRAE